MKKVKELPNNWKLLALNEICDLQNGYAFKSNDYVNISNTLNCRMSNIRPNGFFDIEHNQKFLPDSYTQKYQQYLLKDGDVIIAMTDMATEAKILGIPTIVKTQGKNLLLNQRVGKLIIQRPELIDFSYLKYVLSREKVKKYFLKFAGGGLQINLGKEDILSVEIPLPPLEEQKRIAEILDRASSLISKRKDAIAKLDTLTQSIFIEMFGDPLTNKKNWTELGVEDTCELIVDCVNRTAQIVDYPTPFKMIRTSNVKNGKVSLDEVRYVTEETFKRWNRRATPLRNDVILTREAPLGEAGILDSDDLVFLGQRLMLYRVNPKYLTPEYLLISFRSSFLQQQFDKHGSGSTVKHLSLPACRSFRILVPPLPLQKEFAQRIEAVKKLKATHRASLTELQALFASLQHRAFRGEL